MPVITVEELKERFENPEVRTIDDLMLWIERQTVARSADYNDVVSEAHQKILDSFPALGHQQEVLFGRRLSDYSGFSHERLQSLFGLTPEEATQVQNALGVS
ncbi:MAG TPA: hypothetical protein VLB46_11875 [Pyrinomonadaceae bacterium]|nr:hypothetical protein [Pyrinomonadaceae bacterium]